MDWTEDMIARIRDLWAEGHSTAEIGRRMGVTKNAIVGKAHRLALPPRPSPIRKMADGAAPARGRTPGGSRPTRPEIPRPTNFPARGEHHAFAPQRSPFAAPRFSQGLAQGPAHGPAAQAQARGEESPAAERPSFRPLSAAPREGEGLRAGRIGPRVHPCCWPIGEPGTPEFRFCNAEAVTARPYCEEHVQVAYVKVRDRREDAA